MKKAIRKLKIIYNIHIKQYLIEYSVLTKERNLGEASL